jgi:precorrin-6Y C5,15-methyltransferase (decarboxylating)
VVRGQAPDVLSRLPKPDAVFIGGGLTTPLLVDACWEALPIGGRLVATAYREDGEAVLADWFSRVGGDLVRIVVQHAAPAGSDPEWTEASPVTIWSANRW